MSICSGVLQGSVLIPLLFSIFINDLSNSIKHCKIALYADDTAIFFAHKDVPIYKLPFNKTLVLLIVGSTKTAW